MERLVSWRALRGLAVAVLALAATTVSVSDAAFVGITGTVGSVGAGQLTGSNAPAQGLQFTSLASAGGCDLTWTSLGGGTAVADRLEIENVPSGTPARTTANGQVGAGTHFDPSQPTLSSYRIRSAAGTTWRSSDADSAVTTCIDYGTIAVSAGDFGSCGIRTDGRMWCWGLGESRAIGSDDYITHTTPFNDDGSAWRQVEVGYGHGCGIKTDGSLWCWGENWAGQLGDGTTTDRVDPVQVGAATDWITVVALNSSTCGVRSPGSVWCWGWGGSGQLGNGTTGNSSSPSRVGTQSDWVAIDGLAGRICGIRAGDAYCWGSNHQGQLGDGTMIDRSSPVLVSGGIRWGANIATGLDHTCAIDEDSALWCWGTNWYGESGRPTSSPSSVPVMAGTDRDWAQVSGGRFSTCGIKVDRSLWCAGNNDDGRTGIGVIGGATGGFVRVGSGNDWGIIDVGDRHSCAIRVDSTLWCWGTNNVGGVGQLDMTWASPVAVDATAWTTTDSAWSHTCGIRTNGSLWCWGNNSNGRLGIGNSAEGYTAPTAVQPGSTFLGVSGGDGSTCAVRSDRTLWCWGANGQGQLGIGTRTQQTVPVQVGTVATWDGVEVGREHACATRTDGTLWCWGQNDKGQLGDGTTTDRLTPTRIGAAVTTWADLALGYRHTCATRTDGGLWCWGANGWGQVGDNSAIDRSVPTRVGTAGDWTSVGAGRDHSCGVRASGGLWCWGKGTDGQIGDGSTVSRYQPVAVTGTNWAKVDGGQDFTCGLTGAGELRCWGRNGAGQFGVGTTNGINPNPVSVFNGMSDFSVSTGQWHVCGLDSQTMRCWGANTHGQLGYDAIFSSPVQVAGNYLW